MVGAGISGLVSAYVLAKAGVNVVLYGKEDCLGEEGIHGNTQQHVFDFDHIRSMLLNPVIT